MYASKCVFLCNFIARNSRVESAFLYIIHETSCESKREREENEWFVALNEKKNGCFMTLLIVITYVEFPELWIFFFMCVTFFCRVSQTLSSSFYWRCRRECKTEYKFYDLLINGCFFVCLFFFFHFLLRQIIRHIV